MPNFGVSSVMNHPVKTLRKPYTPPAVRGRPHRPLRQAQHGEGRQARHCLAPGPGRVSASDCLKCSSGECLYH